MRGGSLPPDPSRERDNEMDNDSCENTTHLPADDDAYATADEQFMLDEDYERRLRHAPRVRRDILITAEDRRLGLEDIRQAQERYKELTT